MSKLRKLVRIIFIVAAWFCCAVVGFLHQGLLGAAGATVTGWVLFVCGKTVYVLLRRQVLMRRYQKILAQMMIVVVLLATAYGFYGIGWVGAGFCGYWSGIAMGGASRVVQDLVEKLEIRQKKAKKTSQQVSV